MAASNTLTWDILVGSGGARRPSLDDVGGALLVDAVPAPDKGSMPYADQLNELQRQAAAFGRSAPSAIISVHISGSTPSIVAATGPGTLVVPGLFTVTDNGIGDTSITWSAASLPAPTGIQPMATVNSGISIALTASTITNGVRVKTYTSSAGTAVDADFTVEVF